MNAPISWTSSIGGGFPASVSGSFLCMIMNRMVAPALFGGPASSDSIVGMPSVLEAVAAFRPDGPRRPDLAADGRCHARCELQLDQARQRQHAVRAGCL